MKQLFLIPVFQFTSCNTSPKKNASITTAGLKFDTTLIKGAWQFCTKFKDFNLVEFNDSAYQYFEQEQYTGPSFVFSYTIAGDSLFLDSEETSAKYKWLINDLDSMSITLIDEYGTTVLKKTDIEHSLKDYKHTSDQDYSNQFFDLKKKLGCQ